jgi:hypothetical protein
MAKDYPPFRYFICPTCDKNLEMTQDELIYHLEKKHDITVTTKTKASRVMILHMNKKPRHSGTYEWTFGPDLENGLTIFEYYG